MFATRRDAEQRAESGVAGSTAVEANGELIEIQGNRVNAFTG
jgi:hypothetical protein